MSFFLITIGLLTLIYVPQIITLKIAKKQLERIRKDFPELDKLETNIETFNEHSLKIEKIISHRKYKALEFEYFGSIKNKILEEIKKDFVKKLYPNLVQKEQEKINKRNKLILNIFSEKNYKKLLNILILIAISLPTLIFLSTPFVANFAQECYIGINIVWAVLTILIKVINQNMDNKTIFKFVFVKTLLIQGIFLVSTILTGMIIYTIKNI